MIEKIKLNNGKIVLAPCKNAKTTFLYNTYIHILRNLRKNRIYIYIFYKYLANKK